MLPLDADDRAGGVFRGEIVFANPTLRGYRWPCFEVHGERLGPRLCVTAGVHVNEVAAIEAAIRLQARLAPGGLRGVVSIIPLVNLPALADYAQYICPVDGRNINFTFPGRPDGSFSEALCHALLFEWAAGADCYVDLHGGDLREDVAKFVMFQRTGEPEGDAFRRSLALCFDADLVVGFDPDHMARPGRPPTALARFGRTGVMSEAGANGLIDGASVAFHLDGVLRIAHRLGMIDGTPEPVRRRQTLCHDYLWVGCPADGLFYAEVEPGQAVHAGQALGVVRDLFGRTLAGLTAPASGYVLWRMTHPALKAGDPALAIATPAPA